MSFFIFHAMVKLGLELRESRVSTTQGFFLAEGEMGVGERSISIAYIMQLFISLLSLLFV